MRKWTLALLVACSQPSASPQPTREPAREPQREQGASPMPPTTRDYPGTCRAIADDIERLRTQYPQLVDFRIVDALRPNCTISYGWHTHRPTTRGGWTSGVPEPDPDGIWFYIGVYDPNGPDAQSQIHTQPMVPNWWIGERRVMFLLREGDQAKKVGGELMKVLAKHGMVTKQGNDP